MVLPCKRPSSLLLATALAALALALLFTGRAAALVLPAGFQADKLDIPRHSATEPNGLEAPVSIAFAPDGRRFVTEKLGKIVTFDSTADNSPTLTADISDQVQDASDRGLTGLAIDPAYPAQPYVYISYAYDSTGSGDGCVVTGPNYTNCPGSGRVARIRIDPATGVASNGTADQPVDPPQTVLASGWCMQFPSHAIDDLAFAPDGQLLASAGDGADYATADYGQYGNPCGDPLDEGGSFRSQDWMTSGDPLGYGGSVIRINPHPADPAHPDAPTMLAYGLRNPFRIQIRPGTNELWIGDVGHNLYEEIDRTQASLSAGQEPPNFGWPCYEGPVKHPDFDQLPDEDTPICQTLYANNTTTSPWLAYAHGQSVTPDDGCYNNTGSSITGLAFYQPSLATEGDPFPPGYDGALFFADYSRRCVVVISPQSSGATSDAIGFASSSKPEQFTPVEIVQGPDGLYIPSIQDNSITRIRYFASNLPPVASLTADQTFGPVPLHVKFDASGSTDPEGGDLDYAWDLDGDGQFDDGPDKPTASWTYSDASNVTAKVRVSDGADAADTESLTVYPGDLGPPAPVIDAPSPDLQYTVGDTITYSGHATDPDAGQHVQLDWEFLVRHCPSDCHTHPLGGDPDSPGGTLVAPPHEDPSHVQFVLTATDARGLSATVTRDIYPRRVAVDLGSNPAGVPLIFQATSGTAPWSTTMPAGNEATVVAPETASVRGVAYRFTGWSDGGDRAHNISPRDDLSLTAYYSPSSFGTVRLRSKPAGIPLRLGALRRRAPFAGQLPVGSESSLVAPQRVRRAGRIWVFDHWSNDDRRKQRITVTESRILCAIYRVKR